MNAFILVLLLTVGAGVLAYFVLKIAMGLFDKSQRTTPWSDPPSTDTNPADSLDDHPSHKPHHGSETPAHDHHSGHGGESSHHHSSDSPSSDSGSSDSGGGGDSGAGGGGD